MKNYQITLNEHQLRLIADCIEDCSRFLAGQTEMWNTISQLKDFPICRDKLEGLHFFVTPNLERGASYGWSGGDCPVEWQRKRIAETYYLYRTMLYALHKDDKEWNVYTSPALRCDDSGEVIKIEEV